MAIWVSRYANKALKNERYYCVGISIGKPRFKLDYKLDEQCFSLAPKGYMLQMELDKFENAYYKKLEDIGTERIIRMVLRMKEEAERAGKDLVLLCFEDVRVPGDWCHRTVFAKWWRDKTGEIINELPDPTPPKMKRKDTGKPEAQEMGDGYQQMSLFGMGMKI